MTGCVQIEAYTRELNAAVETLASHCQNADAISEGEIEITPQPLVAPEAPIEAHRARRSILASIAKLKILLAEPTDILQELARQSQLLACIRWLGQFQVLACIPLRGNVPFKDVAELVGVPEPQLRRIVRMAATAGFLHEPLPGHVAHSALSAPFVKRPSYLDAAMFLSETAAPAALHMTEATQRFGQSHRPHESAYNVGLNTSITFADMCEQQSKLQRQWPAFLRYALGGIDSSVTDVLTYFDWPGLGKATVVEVGAPSTATALALAELNPALHLIVQMSEPLSPTTLSRRGSMSNGWASTISTPETRLSGYMVNRPEIPSEFTSRITVQKRTAASLQNVEGAAVYVLHLPSPSPTAPSRSLPAQVIAELKAHLGVLRASVGSRLILIARLLPENGIGMDPEVAATARMRDLSLLQLANDHEIEMAEFLSMLNSVGNSTERLVLVKKLHAWNNATVAFELKYQAYIDGTNENSSLLLS